MNSSSVSWLRSTWQVSWHRKHSMHLRNSWLRSPSSCCQRHSLWGTPAGGVNGVMRVLTS